MQQKYKLKDLHKYEKTCVNSDKEKGTKFIYLFIFWRKFYESIPQTIVSATSQLVLKNYFVQICSVQLNKHVMVQFV